MTKNSKGGKRHWQEIALEAQEYRDRSISRVQPSIPDPEIIPKNVMNLPRELLTEEEIHITELLPEDLLSVLASGEKTATAVTKAFLRCAGLAQRLVSCSIDQESILIPMLGSR